MDSPLGCAYTSIALSSTFITCSVADWRVHLFATFELDEEVEAGWRGCAAYSPTQASPTPPPRASGGGAGAAGAPAGDAYSPQRDGGGGDMDTS